MQLDLAGKILALYYRISDEGKQGKNFSIGEQKVMRDFCEEAGATCLEFIEMEGASQFSQGLERTKLNEVMQLAREKKIHGIMYFKSDRFTRDMADGIILRRELYRLGVKLYCYYPFPREINSDMELLNIVEDMGSQAYITNLREASMRGYKGKLKAGLYPAGKVPYGYILSGKKHDTDVKIHPVHGKIVQSIFYWRAYERLSTGQIAKRLISMSIPTPGEHTGQYRKRAPGEWTSALVLHILKEECYTGVWYGYRYSGNGKTVKRGNANPKIAVTIPTIVEQVVWDLAQTVSRVNQKTHDHIYLLSSLSFCICGAKMGGTHRKNKDGTNTYYYRCSADRIAGRKACMDYYRCDHSDYHAWEYVKELVLDPSQLFLALKVDTSHALIEERLQTLASEITERRNQLQELITIRISAKSVTLIEVYDNQAEQIAGAIEELERKKIELEKQLASKEHAQSIAQSYNLYLEAITAEIDDITRTNDTEAMKRVITLLGLTIVFRKEDEKYLDIYWNNVSTSKRIGYDNKGLPLLSFGIRLETKKITPP